MNSSSGTDNEALKKKNKFMNMKKLSDKKKRIILDTLEFSVLALPGIIFYLIFQYLPMYGLIIAFKDYRYDLGIWGSKWVGFKNFEFFFKSAQALRVTGNTVYYGIVFTIVGLVIAVIISLLLFEINSKNAIKVYQTAMFLPNFMSWVLVSFIVFLVLNPTMGIAGQVMKLFGLASINFYNDPKYWPFVLTFTNTWKHVGLSAIMYYAGLMSIDKELYEAAEIDGAGKFRQTLSISIPHLTPLMTILTIMAVGNFFKGDFGLFYNVPRNLGMLYPTTDIIDTYVYRGLMQLGDIGMSSAVGLFQSVVGLILVLLSNWAVRKINSDNSLF